MPLPKPYPPEEIDYTHWEDLADNYAGKATTLIVDAGGKGDYSTIQEAVDAMPASNAGEVLVRAGEYLLAKAVSIEDREDLVIRGVGKATRLRVAGKVQELVTADAEEGQRSVEVEDGSSFQPGQHVCVRDDSASEVNLVEAVDGDTLTMAEPLSHTYEVGDDARVYTCHSAVHVTGESRRVKILNLSIDGNRLSQEFGRTGYYPAEHHGDGIRLSASTEDCVVEGCWIHSAAAHGVCVGGGGHRIAHNHCWDNGYDGVNVEPGCDRILVLGNHCFEQADWNGIQVGYSTNPLGSVLVEGNHCHGNHQGIAAQGGAQVSVVGNVLQNNRFDGLELYSLDRFLVSGNLITGADDLTDMTNEGIHVEQGCSVGVITGNLIELCAGDGINVEDGAYVSVAGNTVRKVLKHGIKVGSSGRDCTVSGNVVVGADQNDTETYSGIAVLGDRCAVTGNRLDDCDKYAIHVASSADRTLVLGNQCTQYVGSSLGYIQDDGSNSLVDHNVVS